MKKQFYGLRLDQYHTHLLQAVCEEKNLSPNQLVQRIVEEYLNSSTDPTNEVKDWDFMKSELNKQSDLLKSIQEEVLKVKSLNKNFTVGMWKVNSEAHSDIFNKLKLDEDPRCLFSGEGIYKK
jgi:hypothetical protein